MLIKLAELAVKAGKDVKPGQRVYWKPHELPAAVRALAKLLPSERTEELCVLDGAMPHSLAVALIHSITTMKAAVLDPNNNNGTVEIINVTPVENGSFLKFSVKEVDELTLVDFTIMGGFMHVSQLQEVAPPIINPAKGVVISGHGPHWLTGTLALAYKDLPFVAMRQLSKGATIAISNDPSPHRRVGQVFPEDVIKEAWDRILAPKRGEVWFFNNGNGPHPGVVISLNKRNQRGADVMLIPLTSQIQKYRPHRQNVLIRAGTGDLKKDCLAMCHQVTTVSKDRLMSTVLGAFDASLLETLIFHVRCAMGDGINAAAEEDDE